MKTAAIGIRTHSGWGALLATSGDAALLEVVDRRRIVIADPDTPGATQPYHFAANLELPEAKRHLSSCASISEQLAVTGLRAAVEELHGREYRVVCSAVLRVAG